MNLLSWTQILPYCSPWPWSQCWSSVLLAEESSPDIPISPVLAFLKFLNLCTSCNLSKGMGLVSCFTYDGTAREQGLHQWLLAARTNARVVGFLTGPSPHLLHPPTLFCSFLYLQCFTLNPPPPMFSQLIPSAFQVQVLCERALAKNPTVLGAS